MHDNQKKTTIVGWLHIALNLSTIGFAIFASIYFDAIYLPLALIIFSIPGLIAGIGLIKRRPWARIFVIGMSILNLLAFPHGTLIGVYSLIILFDQEIVLLFTREAVRQNQK